LPHKPQAKVEPAMLCIGYNLLRVMLQGRSNERVNHFGNINIDF
jgi:hypothetical protein